MGSRALLAGLSLGVILGGLSVASLLHAQSSPAALPSGGAFEIVDTPGSTFLLNKQSGDVWRIGFTEIKGDRFWFGTYVPFPEPISFGEFQENLRVRAGRKPDVAR